MHELQTNCEIVANHVYLVIKKNCPISKDLRLQWFFKNLNKIIDLTEKNSSGYNDDFQVASVIQDSQQCDVDLPIRNHLLFKVVPTTLLTFLAHRYAFVFCLDLSPSVAVTDVQQSQILIEEIFLSLKECLQSLIKPFYIPGSSLLFQPQLFVTIIAQIPSVVTFSHQVLIQGWNVTESNLNLLLDKLNSELIELEIKLADLVQTLKPCLDEQGQDKSTDDARPTPVSLGLENDLMHLMRQGILATDLLPKDAITGIVVVTDGMISISDNNLLDAVLSQLRANDLSCSFLQLGTPFHPQSCFGYIPFADLMHFIAFATRGTYFTRPVDGNPCKRLAMNFYHCSLFTWNFHSCLASLKLDLWNGGNRAATNWNVWNHHFYTNKEVPYLRKKHQGSNIHTSLFNVLSCRLREGYMLRSVALKGDNLIEVTLMLPWKQNVNLLYIITTIWPSVVPNASCHYEIVIESTYEFLHDFTYSTKEMPKSFLRMAVIKKFCSLLHGLHQTDHLLNHLQSFALHPVNYSIPESMKSRVPLFSLTPNYITPALYSSDFSHSAFQTYWMPVCMLDVNIWQKWMHTHRINLILEHDQPIPKHLHLPNASGRYQVIQCRQAMASLQMLLSEWCSFILVENQSYVKFIYSDNEKPPQSFCVARITSKAPSIVIKLAFLGGTLRQDRFQIKQELKDKILSLTFPQRPVAKDSLARKGLVSSTLDRSEDIDRKVCLRRGSSQASCCILLVKPLDKILMTYEKVPNDFWNTELFMSSSPVVCPRPVGSKQRTAANSFPTVSRYLYHRRWIWGIQNGGCHSINIASVGRILNTLVKTRLKENFAFAHTYSGMVNLVLQLEMKQNASTMADSLPDVCKVEGCESEIYPCLVQYVLFPPHSKGSNIKESMSEDDIETEPIEMEEELQLICECWIEPQVGLVTGTLSEYSYLEGLDYKEVVKKIFEQDEECISTLVTFEHLSCKCQNTSLYSTKGKGPVLQHVHSPSVTHIPFVFSLMNLLQKSHQTELLFSTYIQNIALNPNEEDNIDVKSDGINELLFDLLCEHLAKLHDKEIQLNEFDHVQFLKQIMQRERDPGTHPFPFNCLNNKDEYFSKISNQNSTSSSKISEQSSCKENDEEGDRVPSFMKWKCFVKAYSATHVLLTFLPASLADLKKLCQSSNISPDFCSVTHIGETESELVGFGDVVHNNLIITNVLAIPEEVVQNVKADLVDQKTVKGSMILPIYVYDCPLANLVDHLVYKEKTRASDIHLDFTFKYKMEVGEDTVTLKSEAQSNEPSKTTPDRHVEGVGVYSDMSYLNCLCHALELLYSKCFVTGIFRNLHLKRSVNPFDVQMAMDSICSETVLEIDITSFLQTVCKHIRDFKMRSILEKVCSGESESTCPQVVCHQNREINTSDDVISNDDTFSSLTRNFPISLLHVGSECLNELHYLIKRKFRTILQKTFTPISCLQDFFFYCPPNFQQNYKKSESLSENEIENISQTSNDDLESETFKSETVEFRSEHGSTSFTSHKLAQNKVPGLDIDLGRNLEGSNCSQISNVCSGSIDSLILAMNESNDNDEDNIPPFFIHLTCTVKAKSIHGSCSVQCIPACLAEIMECFENSAQDIKDIDLNDLQVTLDINCLTLPADLEAHLLGKSQGFRTTSFCSISPMSSENQFGLAVDSSSEDEYQTESQDQLAHLPDFQHRAVTNAIEEIKWMLRDEIASALLNVFPLNKSTMDMVASHVESSSDHPGCFLEEVPLQFVFGPEQSLGKFIQEFRQITLAGYQLRQEDKYYYLGIKHSDSTKSLNEAFHASIGLPSKFFFSQTSPHADDNTALHQLRNCAESCTTSDDGQNALTEQLSSRKAPLHFKSKENKRHQSVAEYYTETEENHATANPENRARKRLCEKYTAFLHDLPVNKVGFDWVENKQESMEDPFEVLGQNVSEDAKRNSMDEQLQSPCINSDLKKSASSASLQLSEKLDTSGEDRVRKIASWTQMVHRRHTSGTNSNTPGVGSDISSIMGSGQCSNEDGYEGDSSDIENESDCQNEFEIYHPLLPEFWLILQILPQCIKVFFHSRDPEDENEQLLHGKDVVKQVIKNIKNVCKIVNQSLLLQDLHETRICNQLLEPEGSEDIWKKDDHYVSKLTGQTHSHHQLDDDLEGNSYQDCFLKANLDFMPGAFACNVVWQKHFILHPRLKTGPGRKGVSRGFQALRTALAAFSVSNRENMFVYSEASGSVFYLRLNESQCQSHAHQTTSDLTPGSRSSSMAILPVKRISAEIEEEYLESRPRVNSTNERDHNMDAASVTSYSSLNRSRMEDSIQLLVHGIREAGLAIKEDLVQVLQNRLDEAVLEVISVTLMRNPMCKLTKEDVQFLQRSNEAPKTEIYFTIHAYALPYLQAVGIYLRQNLQQFLHVPKYIDNNADSHFQDHFSSSGPFSTKENDVFLYNRPQGSGNKGIALIAFAIVDGMGNLVQYVTSPKPSRDARDAVAPFEFEMLTMTALHDLSNVPARHPGPVALIRFSIWERGKLDMEQLTKNLERAIRHSLWDVIMEYVLLIKPLTESLLGVDTYVCSEPVTPIKGKYTSRAMDSSFSKCHSSSPSTLVQVKFRELSASVPDLVVKSRSPITSPKDNVLAATFKMAPPSVPCTPHQRRDTEIAIGIDAEALRCHEACDARCSEKLQDVYTHTMKDWMEYAVSLNVPSITKNSFTLMNRYSLMNVIREFQAMIKNQGAEITLKVFRQTSDGSFITQRMMMKEKCIHESCDHHKEIKLAPGKSENLIIVGRDIKQWRASMACLEDEHSSIFPQDCFTRHNQKYPSTYQTGQPQDHSDSPSLASYGSNATCQLPNAPNPGFNCNNKRLSFESDNFLFIPRQTLLFVKITDKKQFDIYTYNWASELLNNILQHLTSLIQWNNSRSRIVTNVVMQKMGLFYNQPTTRKLTKLEVQNKELFPNLSSLASSLNEMEVLKFSAMPTRDLPTAVHLRRNFPSPSNSSQFLELLRDVVPPFPIQRSKIKKLNDIAGRYSSQLQEICQMDNKEQRRKLMMALQGSGNLNCSNVLNEDCLHFVHQISRVEHYCLTPLLFLPQWRWQVAATRDCTMPSTLLMSDSTLRKGSESRHSSGGSVISFDTKGRRQSVNLPILQSVQNSPKNFSPRPCNEDVWHVPLCLSYIQEFIQYLQNLGFVPLQTKGGSSKRSTLHRDLDCEPASSIHRLALSTNQMSSLKNNIHYVQKTLLGGSVIILQLQIIEPYFCVRIYCIEGGRLLNNSSRLCNSQFAVAFVDECDKLKVLLHLHSFTYDYHLRSIHSYVSGRQLIFRQGYHLTSFLDDFVKYYQKSPNFSWNLIYHDVLVFEDMSVPADQLYNHLLDHDKLYGMQVLRMIPVIQSSDKDPRNDYVLVQLSSKKVSYKDGNEICHTDDFDISLLISQESMYNSYVSAKDSNAFRLCYYIILTSRRELYPRIGIEKKFGKFRTVATATPIPSRKVSLVSIERPDLDKLEVPNIGHKRSTCGSEKSEEFETNSQNESLKEIASLELSSASSLPSTPAIQISLARRSSSSDADSVATSLNQETLNRTHLGIRQESVNYLGYFSTTEELMNQIMMEQAHAAKEHIHKILAKATIHWRRDSLWKRLLSAGKHSFPEGKKKREDVQDLGGLNYEEFTSLLPLVSSQSLTAIDPRLIQFSNMHLRWYQGLVKLLVDKYAENCRHFVGPDGKTQHVIVLNSHYNDHFMLLTVEAHMNHAKLCAVYRKHPLSLSTTDTLQRKASDQEQTIHQLIEEFINTCCFHLWSWIL